MKVETFFFIIFLEENVFACLRLVGERLGLSFVPQKKRDALFQAVISEFMLHMECISAFLFILLGHRVRMMEMDSRVTDEGGKGGGHTPSNVCSNV